MVKLKLYHQETLITYHPLSGTCFSIGAELENDLVLAEEGVKGRRLMIFKDAQGRWRGQFSDTPEIPATVFDNGARIELGDFSVELEAEREGELIEMPPRRVDRLHLDWVGVSVELKLLMNETRIMAPLTAPVLVTGETGTGKDLVARGLHDLSNRSFGPFVALNCGSLTESLLEDTFFGHEKGSFTGARKIARGVFEQAHRGTLFLDEIGELPLSHQAALLRVLEDRSVRRIGGEQTIPANFRLVAATNRDIEELIREKHFRPDLYHRISTLILETAPLRNRVEDIIPMAVRFLSDMADELGPKRFDESFSKRLQRYSWPGNVRELKNVLYRVAAMTFRETLGGSDLAIPEDVSKPPIFKLIDVPPLRLERFIDTFGGNISRAAKALGVARTTLRDRINRVENPMGSVAVDMTG